MNESNKEKPKPDHRKYAIGQFIANLIGALVVTITLVWLVFSLFGEGTGSLKEVRTFLLIFIPCFMLIQCHTAMGNTRRDFLRGRWVMGEGETSLEPDSIINPWRRIGPLALPAGIVTAVAISLAVPLISCEPIGRLAINLMAFVPLFMVSTVLLGIILPRVQVSLAAALKKPRSERPEPFLRYFFFEHIGPWMVLQGLINAGIGLKQFRHEVLKPESIEAGGVPALIAAGDFGIVFGIIIFFMFLSSDGQVRPDVRLGRVAEARFSRSSLGELGIVPVALLVVVSTAAIMAVTAGIMIAVFYVTGVEAVSVVPATILKTVAALLGCVVGCWLGVWWGVRRETALIRAQG